MRRLNSIKLLAVFATATLIFIIGIFIGEYISNIQITNFQETQKELQLKSFGIDVKYLLLSENPCFAIQSDNVNEELYFMSDILTDMEQTYGKKDPKVLQLVEEYSLLEIRHYLIQKRAKNMCNSNKTLILYFYSNDDCDDCIKQGHVLTFLRKKYLDSMAVYSFNVNINNPAINTLKDMYNITSDKVPAIVINERVYFGLYSANQIEQILRK